MRPVQILKRTDLQTRTQDTGGGRRLRALVVAVAVLAGASLFTQPARAAAPSWWSYTRAATYTQVKSNVMVPVRDGTRLGCVLSRPGTADGTPAAGRFPTIIDNFTPYHVLRGVYADQFGKLFATHGYAVLNCDVRGTGDSEGTYAGILAGNVDQRDGYDLVEWAAAQSWSNGRVGMEGISYGGFTTLGVAAQRPPHLVSIAPIQNGYDVYRDFVYIGGMKTHETWSGTLSAASERPGIGEKVAANWAAHPNHDSYWDEMAFAERVYPRVAVPRLVVASGYLDGFRDALDANYRTLVAGKPDAYLIVGPWIHGSPFGDDLPQLPINVLLAWFDRTLGQKNSAPAPSARVTSYQGPAGIGAGYQEFSAWPAAETAAQVTGPKLYPTGAQLTTTPGAPATATYTGQLPAGSPPPTTSDANSLVFSTAPRTGPLAIRGRTAFRVRVASSSTDANLYAELYDVAPDGTATWLGGGGLKANHRNSFRVAEPLVPGRAYDVALTISPVDWVLAAGHRLTIRLSAGGSDLFDPPTTPAPTVTVSLGGNAPSYLQLPR